MRPPGASTLPGRYLPLILAAAITGLAVAEFDVLLAKAVFQGSTVGIDLHYYLAYARQWLAGDGFYNARQLHGPYVIQPGDSLYPPVTILLFLPFEVLPELLWWAVPLAILGYVVLRLRPARWTLPLFALVAVWPRTLELLIYGNPTMWIGAATAAGIIWAWPAAFVWLKPSLAPFALVGSRRRSWWLATGAVLLACVPFGALWLDYAHVVSDGQAPEGILYSAKEVPFMAAPLVAWLGSAGVIHSLVGRLRTWPPRFPPTSRDGGDGTQRGTAQSSGHRPATED